MEHRRLRVLFLAALCGLALFLRVRGLGEVGLSEDESNKILAVKAYRHWNFSPNAEHPMLMKTLCTVSVMASEKWNAGFNGHIAPEAALRFPVAVTGSVTTAAVYALGVELLNPPAAMIAAVLWAVDINGVALSRIAKEDPLVALFFILGSLFLLRAKRFHFEDPLRARRNYVACGAFFGLLFASKYLIPIIWIPLIYYDVFRFRAEPRWRIDRRTWLKIYAAFALALLVFNPALFFPSTWSYAWDHFVHRRVTHSGYYMMGRIYQNKAFYTFWGQPFSSYLIYLHAKTPWPLLVFLATGLAYTLRRFRDDRFLFLGMYAILWWFLLSLPGGKFTRYMITLMPAVVLLEALGIYLLYAMLKSHIDKRGAASWLAPLLLCATVLSVAGWEVLLNFRYHPYPSLYVAEQGGGDQKRGYYFPQDDFYDAGLREAIREIARVAPQNAIVLGATPAAFEYYQGVYGRLDLRFHSTAEEQLPLDPALKPYILYQDYRRYLENTNLLTFFYAVLRPQFIAYAADLPSVTVYRLCRDPSCVKVPYWKARQWTGMLEKIPLDHNR